MNRLVLVVMVMCLMAVAVGVSVADEPLDASVPMNIPEAVGVGNVEAPAANTPGAVTMPGTMAPTTAIGVDEDYLLMEEDILKMDVWGEPNLSNMQMQITPGGKVNVPYVGDVQAAGLTQGKLEEDIAKLFEDANILGNPRVTITLINMHQSTVRVLGEVRQPGLVVFKDGDTVLDAIAQAGSYTDNAWLEKATLNRRGSDKPTEIDIKQMLEGDYTHNYKLKKGDIISIPPEDYENKIYVMGQVMRPSMYDLKDKTTVLAAVNLAGGPTERASVRNTKVIRGDPNNPQIVACDLTKMFDKGDRSQDIELMPGDVVMVPETKQPNWNKISQILNTILSFTTIRRYGLF